MKTPDEANEAIRKQVEAEMPTPAGGFETDEQAQAHKDAHELRFMQLVNRERDKRNESRRR